jgi:hypothetical protein
LGEKCRIEEEEKYQILIIRNKRTYKILLYSELFRAIYKNSIKRVKISQQILYLPPASPNGKLVATLGKNSGGVHVHMEPTTFSVRMKVRVYVQRKELDSK